MDIFNQLLMSMIQLCICIIESHILVIQLGKLDILNKMLLSIIQQWISTIQLYIYIHNYKAH